MKTAGTSIEIFLSQHCGANDVVTPIYPHVQPHKAQNYMGSWNLLPEILACRARCIGSAVADLCRRRRFYAHMPARVLKVRVSQQIWNDYFKFCVERNPWDKTLSHYHMINDRAGGVITFEEYLEKGHFCINYPKYTGSARNLLVDKVIKYESLMDELGVIFGNLGIPFAGTLGVTAKSEHRKDRDPYQSVFTDEQRRIIEKAFAQEIEMHGYSYG